MKKLFKQTVLMAGLLLVGTLLTAQCVSGNCKTGKGIYQFKSGAKFSGEFKDGKMFLGTYYYKNGDVYIGYFSKNKRNGKGVYKYHSGNVFDGIYENGRKKNGKFTYVDGGRYEGAFKKDKKNGYGKYTARDGKVYEGYWKDDRFLGKDPDNPITTYALVVGVADYKFGSGNDLRFTVPDAIKFKDFLLTGRIGGQVLKKNIVLLTDAQASRSAILEKMNDLFAKADENDRVVFYFSGHGTRQYFVPYDAESSRSSLLSHDDIKKVYKSSKAKYKLLIADACYSGSFKKEWKAVSAKTWTEVSKKYYESQVAVMLSSTGNETSMEHPKIRQGVFSYFLIKGLEGESDANMDKVVSIEELYYYVRNNTYAFVKEITHGKRTQSPIIFGKFDRNMPVCYVKK